eukprot:309528-Chlamydomonas_euryale.AAC.1
MHSGEPRAAAAAARALAAIVDSNHFGQEAAIAGGTVDLVADALQCVDVAAIVAVDGEPGGGGSGVAIEPIDLDMLAAMLQLLSTCVAFHEPNQVRERGRGGKGEGKGEKVPLRAHTAPRAQPGSHARRGESQGEKLLSRITHHVLRAWPDGPCVPCSLKKTIAVEGRCTCLN